MFQGTGDLWFSFDCPSVLTRCQSTEMFWLLLLGSCLLPLLHRMIWNPWPFSHECDIHTIKHTGCQSQMLPRGKGSAVGGKGARAAQAPTYSSEDARCCHGLCQHSPAGSWWAGGFDPGDTVLNSCKELVLPYSELKQASKLRAGSVLLSGRKLGGAGQGGMDVFAFPPLREEKRLLAWVVVFFFCVGFNFMVASVAGEQWELWSADQLFSQLFK